MKWTKTIRGLALITLGCLSVYAATDATEVLDVHNTGTVNSIIIYSYLMGAAFVVLGLSDLV